MTFQELLAAQVASGGQNVITPDNAGRILGLAAQQEANRRLALAEGQQAVQERKNLQAMQAGETPGVVTAPSGAKFVYDKQGNIVGTNAPIGIGDSVDKRFINQGQATAQERALLGPAIRESFMLEMQKQVPKSQDTAKQTPVADVSRGVESLIPNIASIVSPGIGVRAPALPTPEEIGKMQEKKQSLEDLFSASAAPSQEQKTEDTSRADQYRKLKELERYLKQGYFGAEGAGIAIPPAAKIKMEGEARTLREEIAKSGKRSSGIASKTAAPKAKLEEYRALLEALARAQQ